MNESFDSNVPAFQASILFIVCNHALTSVAARYRRFAPLLSPIRLILSAANHLQTSLEEAAVYRPDREAGWSIWGKRPSAEGAAQE